MRKSLVTIVTLLVLLSMLLAGCSSGPTMDDAKAIFRYNIMTTYKDGELHAFVQLTGDDGYFNQNEAITGAMEDKFGTPSHSELRDLCEDARDRGTPITKTYTKGNLEITVSTVPMKNKALVVSYHIVEK